MTKPHPLTEYRQRQVPPLTTAELARELQISRPYLHRIEKRERDPSLKLLRTIREKLGIAPGEIRPEIADLAGEVAQ